MPTPQTEVPMAIQLPEAVDTTSDPAPVESPSGVNWSELSGEMGAMDDDVDIVEGDLEVVKSPPAEEGAPAESVAPVVETTAPLTVESVPSPPVAAPVLQPPVQLAPQSTSDQPPFDLARWEKEQLTGLEKMYAISDTDAQDLQTQPELILPKLAANMHMVITKSLLTAMQGMMPGQIQEFNQLNKADTQARDAFYGANPDLKDHEESVLQVAKIFRAANPTASREIAIKTIGEMTRMSLGLAPSSASTEVAPQSPAPVAKPFSPARGGGGGAVPAKPKNMWAELAEDD